MPRTIYLRTSLRSGAGAVWLMLALVIIGLAALFFLAPEIPRRLWGNAGPPADLGAEPIADTAVIAKPYIPPTPAPSAAKPNVAANTTPAKPSTTNANKKIYAEELAANSLLTDARNAYRAYLWTRASFSAKKVMTLDVSPATRQRAQDIIYGAQVLDKLFSTLNDSDELTRGYDTHPGLIEIVTHGSPSLAVPVRSANDPTPDERDPLVVIEQQKKLGSINVMYKGRKAYFLTSLNPNLLESVKRVDLKPIMDQMQTEFDTRLHALTSHPSSLGWYELGRFAFRNRLDSHVTESMDKALELDPALLTTVREDRAATLLGAMLVHLRSGNKPQAATYLASINKRFADTESGKQAQAYYAGETSTLLTMVKDAEARQKSIDAKRTADRLARAAALGDETAAAKIRQEKSPADETDDLKPISGDEMTADKLMEEGRKLCGEAFAAGISPERNTLYKRAAVSLRKAKGLFADLVKKQPNNQALQQKMMEAGRILYLAVKGLSPG